MKRKKKQSVDLLTIILTALFGLPLMVMLFPICCLISILKALLEHITTKAKSKSVRFVPSLGYSPTMSGQEYELYCAKRLGREGFHNLSLTPDSGDFGADIIGYNRNGQKVCFQCKKYESSVGVSAVQEVLAAKVYYNADRAAVLTTSTFTPAARKLAKSGNVELIERYL